jgi:cellulose synthase/poly-beta-1,6-N-acetylglucosamine synthase-like glycosyltransferase
MLGFLFVVVLVLGINFTLWGLFGLIRLLDDGIGRSRSRRPNPAASAAPGFHIGDVAVLIPAHNEELVLGRTLSSAAALVPIEHVYVVSDGSTDATEIVAKEQGAHVLRLTPGRGKASALVAGLRQFDLGSRYRVVVLVDADTELDADYLSRGLEQFADPRVVAVAGATTTDWERNQDGPLVSRFLLAHRDRVYILTQLLQKFGQGWRRMNVVHIVPGAASMYRVEALAEIELDAPDLVIEDFNMTFEVHHRGLGRVAFHPGVRARTQDPDNFRDYLRQMRRWTLGFWQTVRRHGFWPSRFGLALGITVFELLMSSLFFVSLPLVLVGFGLNEIIGEAVPGVSEPADFLGNAFSPRLLFLAVVVPDYCLTVLAAFVQRRPQYLLLGLGFLGMRIVDAGTALYTLPLSWARRSSGPWVSPARRP